MALTTLWLGALGAFGSAGALFDIFTRRLPNILCGLTLVSALALALASGGWMALALHFSHALLALMVGYGLFMAGVYGGGDGKFYAAAAGFFPVSQMLGLFVAITAAGLVLALGWFALKQSLRTRKSALDDFAKLPYGVAIAAGAIGFGWMTMG